MSLDLQFEHIVRVKNHASSGLAMHLQWQGQSLPIRRDWKDGQSLHQLVEQLGTCQNEEAEDLHRLA